MKKAQQSLLIAELCLQSAVIVMITAFSYWSGWEDLNPRPHGPKP